MKTPTFVVKIGGRLSIIYKRGAKYRRVYIGLTNDLMKTMYLCTHKSGSNNAPQEVNES